MKVNTTDLQNSFGKYLALTEKEDIIISKNGKTVAKLVKHVEPNYYLIKEESNKYLTRKKITYDEYMEIVDSSDQRFELIDGEIYLLASPSFNHQVVVNEISGIFYNFFKDKNCHSLSAPLDIRLFGFATKFEEDPNVVQPDIVVVCDEDNIDEKGRYIGIPTLIVEVLSPSTQSKDMTAKLQLYKKSGISEYWIVDIEKKRILQYIFSEKEIEDYKIIEDKKTITSCSFEGLNVSLEDIFRT
ncbi:Uma2 family endonuclease [Natronospora cellulosivora (SeqCode)]